MPPPGRQKAWLNALIFHPQNILSKMSYVGVTERWVRCEWRRRGKIRDGYNIITIRKKNLPHYYRTHPRYMYKVKSLPPAFQTLIAAIPRLDAKVDDLREDSITFYDTEYGDSYNCELDRMLSRLHKIKDIVGSYLLARDEAIRRRGPLLAFYGRDE